MNRSLLIWILLLVGMVIMITTTTDRSMFDKGDVTTSEFLDLVEKGTFAEVHIEGSTVIGVYEEAVEGQEEKKKVVRRAYISDREELVKLLREKKVKFNETEPTNWGMWISPLIWIGLIVVVFVFFSRMMKGGGAGGMMNQFQKNKGTMYESGIKTRFKDVAGCDESVEEARELVEFLREPSRFQTHGARPPKGILLVGPSGTGKTLLAKAVAGEAGVPFISASGSGFVEMFVGVGAARVRDLFETAKKHKPCIVFIDEIDGLGQKRAGVGRAGGGHEEREQALNELLQQIDGFAEAEGIIVLGASNRPEVLDEALKRAGRFDRHITLPRPDINGREAILKVHARDKNLAPGVDLRVVARGTPGMTGADLENLLNEAAMRAAKLKKAAIDDEDLDAAKDRILMGSSRKGAVISEQELKIVAYHEAGHAIVGWFQPLSHPLHKVTVIPHGPALGLTVSLPEDDVHLHSKNFVIQMIRGILGGRAAEEIVFKDVTTGASNDLEKATELAKQMVTVYGMSKLGNRVFGSRTTGMFLDYGTENRDYSELTARKIDEEVDAILKDAYEKAVRLLQDKHVQLTQLAETLLKEETLGTEAVERILGPRPQPPESETE